MEKGRLIWRSRFLPSKLILCLLNFFITYLHKLLYSTCLSIKIPSCLIRTIQTLTREARRSGLCIKGRIFGSRIPGRCRRSILVGLDTPLRPSTELTSGRTRQTWRARKREAHSRRMVSTIPIARILKLQELSSRQKTNASAKTSSDRLYASSNAGQSYTHLANRKLHLHHPQLS